MTASKLRGQAAELSASLVQAHHAALQAFIAVHKVHQALQEARAAVEAAALVNSLKTSRSPGAYSPVAFGGKGPQI